VPIPAIPIIPDLLFYPFFNVVFDSTFFRVRQDICSDNRLEPLPSKKATAPSKTRCYKIEHREILSSSNP
jgi:hypothetical protein